jgi:transcription termination factor Rho
MIENKQDTHRRMLEFENMHAGFLRKISIEMERHPDDVRVPPQLIRQWKLREGCLLDVRFVHGSHRGSHIKEIVLVNGKKPNEWLNIQDISHRTAVNPNEHINLTTSTKDISMRIVDLLCPVGKGQRALIVAPPRSGKTILMQKFAHAVSTNHPEIDLMVLLVDERPEEVTDMRRTVQGQIFASSSDSDRESHVRLARIVLEYAKRKIEAGNDVVLLIDSLTKMGRAFNAMQRGSGKTLSGGVDSRALEIPKKIFGAARALEGGGSLTIIATALIETNSRMDDLIFEEFKGTGNMELVLDRELANERIFPAINIPKSGTRREELLFGGETSQHQMLRRTLHRMKPKEAMLTMLKLTEKFPQNRTLLEQFEKGRIEI